MKIGILTFHRSYNYGAYLQCFALVNTLKKQFPDVTVEVIDYTKKSTVLSYNKFAFFQCFRHPSTIPETIKRRRMFEKYANRLPLSKNKLITDDVTAFKTLYTGKYDVIIVGSDVVWRIDENRFPTAYWLMGDFGCAKMSYAAASHHTQYANLQSKTINYCRKSLQNFDYIGIRDESTMNFVKKLVPNCNVNHNCDPTVLLDLEAIPVKMEELRHTLYKCKGFDPSKKTICLMMREKYITNLLVDKYSDKYNIVAVYTKNTLLKSSLYDMDIFQWARIFAFFDLTVTTFFHGTLFSLKNNTPVISINIGKLDEQYIGKTEDILTRLGMKERFFHLSDIKKDNSKFLDMIEDILLVNEKPDYTDKLREEQKYFKSFSEKLKLILNSGDKV